MPIGVSKHSPAQRLDSSGVEKEIKENNKSEHLREEGERNSDDLREVEKKPDEHRSGQFRARTGAVLTRVIWDG